MQWSKIYGHSTKKYLLEFQLHTYTKKVEHVHFGNNSLLKVGMHFHHTSKKKTFFGRHMQQHNLIILQRNLNLDIMTFKYSSFFIFITMDCTTSLRRFFAFQNFQYLCHRFIKGKLAISSYFHYFTNNSKH